MRSLLSAIRLFAAPILGICFLASCASTKTVKLSAADRKAMAGRTFTTTAREMPAHAVLKQSAMAAGALGGAIGGAIVGAVAVNEGNDQVGKHGIPNPTQAISEPLANHLVSEMGMRRIKSNHTTGTIDPEKIASENRHADYVLDCFTTIWGGGYYSFSIGKYFITYGARMQLIETSTGRVVAGGYNFYQGKDRSNAPDYDGIYSNGAAFLRSETSKGTSAATDAFKKAF